MATEKERLMENIVSLAKRRGFVFQGSEIYGGIAGMWDYGPLGVELAHNIKDIWWRMFVYNREDMYGIDASILMNPRVWETSGHTKTFSDPVIKCVKCKKQFRADQLDNKNACPACGGKLSKSQPFNLMFKTYIGATEDSDSISYLRPETAGGIFVNFKNVVDSMHPKLPFGIAQIGKAFRNEIAPRDFLFRLRELKQMEIEYFVRAEEWERAFEEWRLAMLAFAKEVGIPKKVIHELEVPESERAHYSKRTIDFEFDYPFGKKELWGLAYRTDYDLSRHAEASGADLTYFDEEENKRFIPHVIEPSFGVDRTFLAVLLSAYRVDEIKGEKRVFLAFKPAVAPIKVAVFPLLKNKPELVTKARNIYQMLKKHIPQIDFDDNGNIGKRYRRQDEIGTPYCVTIDFDTLEDNTVTLRDRDTTEQERVNEKNLLEILKKKLVSF
ncbi:glycine--tRNA ligase [Candidatus Kaiserbacteria bacterium]|nr:glycine--tRNA ligase [Candidatus Kaiserbacteria bacterium]